jgi:hypothetical protein
MAAIIVTVIKRKVVTPTQNIAEFFIIFFIKDNKTLKSCQAAIFTVNLSTSLVVKRIK